MTSDDDELYYFYKAKMVKMCTTNNTAMLFDNKCYNFIPCNDVKNRNRQHTCKTCWWDNAYFKLLSSAEDCIEVASNMQQQKAVQWQWCCWVEWTDHPFMVIIIKRLLFTYSIFKWILKIHVLYCTSGWVIFTNKLQSSSSSDHDDKRLFMRITFWIFNY